MGGTMSRKESVEKVLTAVPHPSYNEDMHKFPPGRVVATAGVNAHIEENNAFSELMSLLGRHLTGDWGDVDAEDAEANDQALIHGSRILSAFTLAGEKVWIITEADRSATTVLFPSEY